MPSPECEENLPVPGEIEFAAPQCLSTGSDKAGVPNHEDTSSWSCKATDDAPAPTAAPPPWPSNKTGYRGVRQRRKDKWAAEMYDSKKKRVVLGIFDSPEAAAAAYDTAAVSVHGSRARLNFPSAEHQSAAAARCVRARRNRTSSKVTTMKRKSCRRGIYPGVVPWPGGKWGAQIYVKKKKFTAKVWLGTFDSSEAAARAFHKAAIDFRGSRAKINLSAGSHGANIPITTFSDLTIHGPAEGNSAAPCQISTVQAVTRNMAPTNPNSSPEPEHSDGYLYLDEIESTRMP